MRVINTQKSAKRRCEKSANHATSQANLGENMSKYQKLPRMKKKICKVSFETTSSNLKKSSENG